MRRRISKIPTLLIISSVSLFASGLKANPTPDTDGLKTPEDIEEQITGKITRTLSMFMHEKEFRVFATAKVKNTREKILLEGSTEAASSGAVSADSVAVQLPGFTNLEAEKPSEKKVNRNERSRFTFRNRTTVTDVSVRLVLDQALDPKVKELATKTAQETVTMNLGSVAKLDISELDLAPAAASPTTAWEWLKQYLAVRGGSAIDLLYMALLILGSLGTLFALRHYFKSKKALTSEIAGRGTSDVATQDKIEKQCDAVLDALIARLNQHPLITRNFLRNLASGDKRTIFLAVRTPALQEIFKKILANGNLEKGSTNADLKVTQDTVDDFERILKDLDRFISLNQETESKPFGFVALLSGTQIARFLGSESNRVQALNILAPYLTEQHHQAITQALSIEEKASFLAGLRQDSGHLQREAATMSDSESLARSSLEARMRSFFEAIRQESVVDASERSELETAFLESDAESVVVIKQLANRYGKVPTVYEKYLIGFEDVLGIDLGIAKKVMQRVSNEVLAQALADREIDGRMKEILGDMRSQLLNSMKKRGDRVSAEDMQNARNEILRQYRALV